MKFVIFVLCSVLFLGWNADFVSACGYMKTVECMKKNVYCNDAGLCNQACGMNDSCMNRTSSCQSTLSIVKYCANINACSSPSQFKDTLYQICQPNYPTMSAAASILTSFTFVFAIFLVALFWRKTNEH